MAGGDGVGELAADGGAVVAAEVGAEEGAGAGASVSECKLVMDVEIFRWGRNGFDVIRDGVIASRGWSVGHVKSRLSISCQKQHRAVPREGRSCGLGVDGQTLRMSLAGRTRRNNDRPIPGRSAPRGVMRQRKTGWWRMPRGVPWPAPAMSGDMLVEVAPELVADGGSIPPGSRLFPVAGLRPLLS